VGPDPTDAVERADPFTDHLALDTQGRELVRDHTHLPPAPPVTSRRRRQDQDFRRREVLVAGPERTAIGRVLVLGTLTRNGELPRTELAL
jgi:hypothetical protein